MFVSAGQPVFVRDVGLACDASNLLELISTYDDMWELWFSDLHIAALSVALTPFHW